MSAAKAETVLGYRARLKVREAAKALAEHGDELVDIVGDLTELVAEEAKRAVEERDAWEARQRELDREDLEEELETKREQQRERELDATGGR